MVISMFRAFRFAMKISPFRRSATAGRRNVSGWPVAYGVSRLQIPPRGIRRPTEMLDRGSRGGDVGTAS